MAERTDAQRFADLNRRWGEADIEATRFAAEAADYYVSNPNRGPLYDRSIAASNLALYWQRERDHIGQAMRTAAGF